MSRREDAHRLLDAVPDDRVETVTEWLRAFTEQADDPPARRRFRTVGVFDGASDLGARAKEIGRSELGGQDRKTA